VIDLIPLAAAGVEVIRQMETPVVLPGAHHAVFKRLFSQPSIEG